MPTPAPPTPGDERPPLFKLGVALLVVHELIVIGLCALGGILGSFAIVVGSLRGADSDETAVLVLLGALGAFLLMLGMALAIGSLAVAAMAWRGSRVWLQALIAVALLNCVLVAPNPLGILAAILCVLGSLQYLEIGAGETKIGSMPASRAPAPSGPGAAARARTEAARTDQSDPDREG